MNKPTLPASDKIPRTDISLLASVREYKVMSIRQLAAVSGRSCQVVRRRARSLEEQGFITKKPFGYGKTQGRPEEIILLTQKGIKQLNADNTLGLVNSGPEPPRLLNIDHQILLNWFRIHMIQVERSIPCLSVIYHATNVCQSEAIPLVRLHIPIRHDSRETKAIIPDGSFIILHREKRKALLFFVEVDMGTEVLASRKGKANNIGHKILYYQELYGNGQYKLFEERFDAKFQGFRLLFVANSAARVGALCRFIHEQQNVDFIWLTDQYQMFDHGLSANIWVRGGKYENPRQSILGPNLSAESPVLPNIR